MGTAIGVVFFAIFGGIVFLIAAIWLVFRARRGGGPAGRTDSGHLAAVSAGSETERDDDDGPVPFGYASGGYDESEDSGERGSIDGPVDQGPTDTAAGPAEPPAPSDYSSGSDSGSGYDSGSSYDSGSGYDSGSSSDSGSGGWSGD